MKRLLAFVGAILLVPACGENKQYLWDNAIQWKVQINTDARWPRQGDRLLIDVINDDGNVACDTCSREFDLGDYLILPSFGIRKTDSSIRVRARLFRSIRGGIDSGTRVIDVVAKLPPITSSVVIELDFAVPLGCSGHVPDLRAHTTCQSTGDNGAVTDGPEPFLSTRVKELDTGACSKNAPDGMACVGFGVFTLGDEVIQSVAFEYPARPELPVMIKQASALMLDIDEMTVGSVRRIVKAGTIVIGSDPPSSLQTRTNDAACTYLGPDDSKNDDYPINCIGRDLAAAVCRVSKKRLPTEVEWEYAAGNGTLETYYPWHTNTLLEYLAPFDNESTICDTAIVGRGRNDPRTESTFCTFLAQKGKAGPVQGGSPLDVTSMGIRNLGGNVGEWVSDELALYDEACVPTLTQQGCKTASRTLEGKWAPYRGGSWAAAPQATVSVSRFAIKDGAPSPYVGFRCAITEDELP